MGTLWDVLYQQHVPAARLLSASAAHAKTASSAISALSRVAEGQDRRLHFGEG